MSEELERRAKELADNLNYTVIIEEDKTNESDTPIYLLRYKELPGCMAQGETVVDAYAELLEVKAAYIETLLEKGLPVPAGGPATSTAGSAPLTDEYQVPNKHEDDATDVMTDLKKVGRPSYRRRAGEVIEIIDEVAI